MKNPWQHPPSRNKALRSKVLAIAAMIGMVLVADVWSTVLPEHRAREAAQQRHAAVKPNEQFGGTVPQPVDLPAPMPLATY